jgi:hypothetical protein
MSKESIIFLSAVVCLVEALVSLCVWGSRAAHEMKPMAWVVIGIVAGLLLCGWGFYRSLSMVPGFDAEARQEPVTDQIFMNQEVVLDGKAFIRCKFQNVSYIIKGEKPFSLRHCESWGPIVVKTDNMAMWSLLAFQKATHSLRDDIRIEGLRNVEPATIVDDSKPTPSATP